MKKNVMFFTVLAAAVILCLPACRDSSGSDTEVIPPPPPVSTPGIYAVFSGAGGTPHSQRKNMLEENESLIAWVSPGDSESAFLARHGLESYDFVTDPSQFGTAGTTPEFTSVIPKFKYTVEGGSVTVPTLAGYDFDHWEVTNAAPALSGIVWVGGTVDVASFSFMVDKALKKQTAITLSLNAKYVESEEAKNAKKALEGALSDLTRAGSESTYDDEYVIGSGLFTADSAAEAKRRAELNEVVKIANNLLAGSLTTIYTEVDGEFWMDEDGNYISGEGGAILGAGEDPVPVVEEISYIAFNFPEIFATKNRLTKMLSDPLYQFGNFVPSVLTLHFPDTGIGDYKSVTIATTGRYDIELWGASGGHLWSRNNLTAPGGKGAYVKGTKQFNAGDVIKVYVGGEGSGSAVITEGGSLASKTPGVIESGGKNGGWNGGGNGGNSANAYPGASGGGGATDVRYVGTYLAGTTNKHNKAGTENDRIIVAAGGGGASQSAGIGSSWPGIRGGNAGEPGARRGTSTTKEYTYNGGTYNRLYQIGSSYYGMIDGPQPGKNHSGTIPAPTGLADITTGTGGNGVATSGGAAEGAGGGGGGWRGGGAQQGGYNTDWTSSGAGGINYIEPTFTGTSSTLSGIYGNGKATINWSSSN